MRFHPRRAVTFLVVGLCLLMVILNIQQNTSQVSDEEVAAIIRHHRLAKAMDPAEEGAGDFDPNIPGIRYLHTPPGAPNTFRNLAVSKDPWDDRIVAQMEYVPRSYRAQDYVTAKPGGIKVGETEEAAREGLKVIYLPAGLGDTPAGRAVFIRESCPVNACYLSDKAVHELSSHAHVIQSEGYAGSLLNRKPAGQIWILWTLESALNTPPYTDLKGHINWTASYRADSTIVTPYERFVPYKDFRAKTARNYAAGKSRQVAWFVSNCGAMNQRREFAEQLAKYISVDVYGACGQFQCSRSEANRCNQLLNTHYKFYLSFENSNCEYYITEKFFWNGLRNDIVPVVMGGRKEDYERFAPPNSFIHVEDFKSAADLALYLNRLDRNDQLYNRYFSWKSSGEFINTKFWCRVCALLHDDTQTTLWYDDVERWWRSNGTCTGDRWDRPEQRVTDWRKALLAYDL